MDVRSNTDEAIRFGVGGNLPPQTPFELSENEINDLFDEALLACDGASMADEGQAVYATNLLRTIQAAKKKADERRITENKPFDDGKAEVQARYNPLIQKDNGKADRAINAIKAWQRPYLLAKEAAQAKAAAEARAEAEAAQRAAQEARRIADASNLAESNAAEALTDAAEKAIAAAKRAEKATPTVAGHVGRASGLRTSYRAEVTDYTAFARHVWATRKMDMCEFLDDLAQQTVSKGVRDLPGVTVHEERSVV